MVTAGAAVAVVVVVAIMGYIMLAGGGGDDGHSLSDMQVGDYLVYSEIATSGDSTLSYVWWYNVTAVNSTSFTIHETEYLNGYYYAEYNVTIAKADVMKVVAIFPSGMNNLGPMNIDTAFGSREVTHYQGTHMGENLDFYFGSNGILYRYHFVLGGTVGEINLIETSLDWA